MATLDPLKSTLSEGFAYRQAVDGPPRLIILVGIWLLFLPGALILPMVWNSGSMGRSLAQDLPPFIFFALSTAVLYRATANYVRKRRPGPSDDDSDPDGGEGK